MRIYKLDGIKAMPELKPCPSALRVAAYARVSTGKDEQQTSLESQKDYYEKKMSYKDLWEIAGLALSIWLLRSPSAVLRGTP